MNKNVSHEKERLSCKKSIYLWNSISSNIFNVSGIPTVKAYTNQFTNIAATSCTSCTNPITISDKGNNIGDLVVVTLSCTSSFKITGITDTISGSFGTASGTRQNFTVTNNVVLSSLPAGTTTFYTQVWFKTASSTSASTASITTSSSSANCNIQTFDGNTIFSAFYSATDTGASPSSPIPSALPWIYPLSSVINVPANSITLVLGNTIQYIGSSTNCGSGTCDNSISPLSYITSLNTLLSTTLLSTSSCTGASGCQFKQLSGSFSSNTQTNVGLGFIFNGYASFL